MINRNFLLVTLLLLFTSTTLATTSVDLFNTYRFNRKNHDKGLSKIKKTPWFEWWYYKVVLPESGKSFYFIYGVVNPWDDKKSLKGTRSYVGFGDFGQKTNLEEEHPISSFNASYNETYVNVAGNEATNNWLRGSINDKERNSYSWDITIQKKWAFNAAGWATGKMLTNIEWYPAQADALCSGTVKSKGELYKFTDAPCYQDRNWGKSFPDWWTWIVSNQFEGHPNTTLAIGGGNPKFGGIDFGIEGVVVGLKHKGKSYEFRPNNFDKIKIDVNFGKWKVVASDKQYRVEVEAYAPIEDFMDLQFMGPKGKIFHDFETLTGKLTLKLYEKKGTIFPKWKLIETLKSNYAGIEYGSFDNHNLNINTLFNSNFTLIK